MKIFISSKIRGLRAERDSAEKIVKGHKFDPIRCENWGASAQHTEDICRSKVRDSHVVIFILSRRDSHMVRNEYDEARKWKKHCLVFVKQVQNRDQSLEELIEQDMKNHCTLKDYVNLNDFRRFLNSSISDLIESRVRAEKEKAVIHQAYMKCGSLNDVILKANLGQPPQGFQPSVLDGIRRELFSEKRKIEKILGECL